MNEELDNAINNEICNCLIYKREEDFINQYIKKNLFPRPIKLEIPNKFMDVFGGNIVETQKIVKFK